MPLKFKLKTLGCKVNQSESAVLSAAFRELGLVEAESGENAELVLLNTCTVTAKSDYQSRQMIRRAVRENPGARILVTGCYAESGAQDIRRLEGNVTIVPNLQKLDINHYIRYNNISLYDNKLNLGSLSGSPSVLNGRSRAFLKVQDGCDNQCTYCAVWKARGRSRSILKKYVLSGVRSLEQQGVPEVVLTGVHIGFWGRDTGEGALSGLVREILDRTERIRLRISSIEPREVDDDLICLLRNEERVCRHLHIPIQAADNGILSCMGRSYKVEECLDLTRTLAQEVPGICLGTDVIAGFPGESDSIFEISLKLLKSSKFAYFHVFPYSRRSGTVAANLPDQVTGKKVKHRAERLRRLSARLRNDFYRSQENTKLHVIYEGSSTNNMNIKCLSDNYIRFDIPAEGRTPGGNGWAVFTRPGNGQMCNV